MLDKTTQETLIQKGREFTKGYQFSDPYMNVFESDQDRKLPQPPLVKAALEGTERILLTKDFSQLPMCKDILACFNERKSHRVYAGESMSLDQLSFLLWTTQGIKKLRGKAYATLRTVPCGGARHEFETYLAVMNVDGLKPGVYHYLPMEHHLEFLRPVEDLENAVDQALSGQTWGTKANVVFFWSMVPYRAEWRYGIYAHRTALIDAGHIGQNLYLACTALGLGTCAIAAFSHEISNELFRLDGEEEYIVYTAPVGTIREQDKASEAAFYQFVVDENL